MSRAVSPEERWRGRFDRIVPTVFLVALAFVQRPGWLAADTKLDLLVNPGGFLGRALSLWDPLAAGGQLQNQAYGYLFPMGPFFWLGDVLQLPAWVVQRLWWALILVLGYHGTLIVLERLGVGTRWSRMIGAASYALAPRMLMGLGAISSEIWPMAVAPWVLVPLLAVPPGRERAAALRSGVAVLALGAVNAVATLAALVLPLWWILTRRGDVRWRLLGWWSGAVVLATAWWVGPLLLLGRYSPPFLDWIEASRVTTSIASVTEALRGTTQWIASIGGGQNPVWPAGWVVLTSRSVILLGLVVVVAGLVGLALARGPWAAFARGGLLIGLVLVTLGHVGGATGPWASPTADLLDGVLAPFRNTHKFEVVVRLPLALGLAHGLPRMSAWLRRQGAPWPALAPVLVVVALVGQTAAPAFLGVLQRGPFVAVPAAWSEAAAWLDEHEDGGRTLVLPGGNAPARFWGEPHDEPLQPYATAPWIVRDGVPLGSAGATRILTEIEARVAAGHGGPGLLRLFASLGVTRVLLAADHQRPAGPSTPPLVVRAALTASGARSVASFGDIVGGSTDLTYASDWGLDRPASELEVLEVPTSASIFPLRTDPVSGMDALGGGPEGVAGTSAGSVGILAADGESLEAIGGPTTATATDTLQRRQATFSSVTDVYGPLLAADEPYPAARAVHDWLPAPLTADDPDLALHQTVRFDGGTTRASASSSLAEPALGQPRDLASDAWRAFDSNGDTGWQSAGYSAVGQWVSLAWNGALPLPGTVAVTLDEQTGADVAALTVVTDTGTARTPVTSPGQVPGADPGRYVVDLDVPPGPTATFRVVVEAVRGSRPTVRVLDVGAGVLPRVQPWVRLPSTPVGPDVVSLTAGQDDRRACYPMSSGVLACSPDRLRVGEEAAAVRRMVDVAEQRTYDVGGAAVPRGEGADSLLERLDGVRAAASSRWLPEAGLSPQLVVDGDPRTYWAADPADTRPTLRLSWPEARQVTGLRFTHDPDIAGRRPTEVDVTLGSRTVRRVLDPDGLVELPPTAARRVTITVTATTEQRTATATGPTAMPVVVGDVALEGEPWPAVDPRGSVVVPCGFGPSVQVDGRTLETSVSTTRDRLVAGEEAALRVCGEVTLGPGVRRIQALASGQFAVRSLSFDAPASTSGTGAGGTVELGSLSSTERTLTVSASEVATVLVVRENANAGWSARMGDVDLTPVRVEGWAQGWVVPAGASGVVHLTFGPQRLFLLSLVLGATLAAVLLAAAARSRLWRDVPLAEVDRPVAGRAGAVVALVAIGGLTGGVAAAVALVLGRVRRGAVVVVAGAVAAAWVAWSVWRPWPDAAATNRELASGALALLLVGLATTWPGTTARRRGRGPSSGPGLDRGLDEVPADGGHEDADRERDDHGEPEAPAEGVQSQGVPHTEHHR